MGSSLCRSWQFHGYLTETGLVCKFVDPTPSVDIYTNYIDYEEGVYKL